MVRAVLAGSLWKATTHLCSLMRMAVPGSPGIASTKRAITPDIPRSFYKNSISKKMKLVGRRKYTLGWSCQRRRVGRSAAYLSHRRILLSADRGRRHRLSPCRHDRSKQRDYGSIRGESGQPDPDSPPSGFGLSNRWNRTCRSGPNAKRGMVDGFAGHAALWRIFL